MFLFANDFQYFEIFFLKYEFENSCKNLSESTIINLSVWGSLHDHRGVELQKKTCLTPPPNQLCIMFLVFDIFFSS